MLLARAICWSLAAALAAAAGFGDMEDASTRLDDHEGLIDGGINRAFIKENPMEFRAYPKTSSPADHFMFLEWQHLNEQEDEADCPLHATEEHRLPMEKFQKDLKELQGKSGPQIQPRNPGYGLGSIVGGLSKAMMLAWKRQIPLAAPLLGKFSNAKECPKGTWDCLLGNFAARSTVNESARGNGLKIEAERKWLQKFSTTSPYAMPDKWGQTGTFALMATVMQFVLTPSASLAAEMDTQERKIGLHNVDPDKLIGMHIRHGDACIAKHKHHLKYRKCLPLSAYMVHAEKIRKNEGKNIIYLSTDSKTVVDDTKHFPNFKFIYLNRHRAEDGKALYWDVALAKGKLDAYNEAKWAIFDWHFLSAGTAFIGAFTSGFSRIGYTMMVAKHGSKGCWPSFVSIDHSTAMMCMDWGVNEPCYAGDDINVLKSSFLPLSEDDSPTYDPFFWGWYRYGKQERLLADPLLKDSGLKPLTDPLGDAAGGKSLNGWYRSKMNEWYYKIETHNDTEFQIVLVATEPEMMKLLKQRDDQRNIFNDKRMELRENERERMLDVTTKELGAEKAKKGKLRLRNAPGLQGWYVWGPARDRLVQVAGKSTARGLKYLGEPDFFEWFEKTAKFRVDGTNQMATMEKMMKVIKSWTDICLKVVPAIRTMHPKPAAHFYQKVSELMIDAAVQTRQESDFEAAVDCVEQYAAFMHGVTPFMHTKRSEDPELAAMLSPERAKEVDLELAELRREVDVCTGKERCPGTPTRVKAWLKKVGVRSACVACPESKISASNAYWAEQKALQEQAQAKAAQEQAQAKAKATKPKRLRQR